MKHFDPKGIIRIISEKSGNSGSKGSRQWELLKFFNGKTIEDFHNAAKQATQDMPERTYQESNWWVRELDHCWKKGILSVEKEPSSATESRTSQKTLSHNDERFTAVTQNSINAFSSFKSIPNAFDLDLDLEGTGIYIAYPTTSVLKPIYRGYATMVNNNHTKIGMAQDCFRSRKNGYIATFNGEVEFCPIATISVDKLPLLEKKILNRISQSFSKVGRAREWYATNDRNRVIKIITDLILNEEACRC